MKELEDGYHLFPLFVRGVYWITGVCKQKLIWCTARLCTRSQILNYQKAKVNCDLPSTFIIVDDQLSCCDNTLHK